MVFFPQKKEIETLLKIKEDKKKKLEQEIAELTEQLVSKICIEKFLVF